MIIKKLKISLFFLVLLLLFFFPLTGYVGANSAINNDIPPGTMIIEGDIIVPDDFYTAEATWQTNFWPNGIIPYYFGNVTQVNVVRMIAAMAQWEAVANVDFRPLGNETNYIFIQESTLNNSFVGMQGGAQIINIVSWTSKYTIVHELGHALGLWHEQNRPNRNSFVSININCVKTDKRHNYDLQPSAGQYPLGGYDFDSVMHYRPADFLDTSLPGCANATRVITVLPPNEAWQTKIGQRTHLSTMDGLTMSFLYPQSNWRFANVNSTQPFFLELGTFNFPAKSFTLGTAFTPTGGTLWIEPGAYVNSTGIYSTPMIIKGPRGGVTIQ